MKSLKWWRKFLKGEETCDPDDQDTPIEELPTKNESWDGVTNTELFRINDLVHKHIFSGEGRSDLRWYSIKIEDAWEIVDKLTEKKNWRVELYIDSDQVYVDIENGDCNAPWKNSHDDPYVCAHSGDIMRKMHVNKMPLAICIAALRAYGVDVKRDKNDGGTNST